MLPSRRGLGLATGLPRLARSLASGPAEATEALGHVGEAERRLDRNQDGTIKLSFAIVSPGEAATVHRLLYASYYPCEPLLRHLGLCTGLGSVPDLDTRVEERIAKNLTLVAYDETGRPVGAAVNNIYSKEEVQMSLAEELQGVVDPAYHPCLAIRHQLSRENDSVYDEIGIDRMFSIGMVGVERTGLGISTNLIRRSILLAGCLGFRGIRTEATSRFARETFERVGLQPAGTIKYADFTFDGKKVFAGVGDGNTEITFMKKKFFQSSLKHIL